MSKTVISDRLLWFVSVLNRIFPLFAFLSRCCRLRTRPELRASCTQSFPTQKIVFLIHKQR